MEEDTFWRFLPATCLATLFPFSSSTPLSLGSSPSLLKGCSCPATQPLDCGESRQWLCAPRSGRCAWDVPPCAERKPRQGAGSTMSPSPSGWPAWGRWHSHWLTQTCPTAHWTPGSGVARQGGEGGIDEISFNWRGHRLTVAHRDTGQMDTLRQPCRWLNSVQTDWQAAKQTVNRDIDWLTANEAKHKSSGMGWEVGEPGKYTHMRSC